MAGETLLTNTRCRSDFTFGNKHSFTEHYQEYSDEKQQFTGLHAVNKFCCLQSVSNSSSPMWKWDIAKDGTNDDAPANQLETSCFIKEEYTVQLWAFLVDKSWISPKKSKEKLFFLNWFRWFLKGERILSRIRTKPKGPTPEQNKTPVNQPKTRLWI